MRHAPEAEGEPLVAMPPHLVATGEPVFFDRHTANTNKYTPDQQALCRLPFYPHTFEDLQLDCASSGSRVAYRAI